MRYIDVKVGSRTHSRAVMVALDNPDQEIFGGAITIWIPEGFNDVRYIRAKLTRFKLQ